MARQSGRPPRAALLLLTLSLGAFAAAQVASVGGVVDDRGASAILRVTGVREGAGSVDAWARVGGDVAFGAVWRHATVFGALGNVIVEGGAGMLLPGPAEGLGARVTLGARGVAGPVAASLRLDAGTVSSDALDPGARADDARAALGVAEGGWDAGAGVSFAYRLDRATLLGLEPRFRLAGDGRAASVALTLQRSAVLDVDLWLGVEASALAGRRSAAAGFGAVWTRRREPDSWLRVWVGGDGEAVLPGVEALVATRSPSSATTLSASWVPHRLDARAWRVALEASTSPQPGSLWRLAAAAAGGAGGPTFVLTLSLDRPWTSPGP